MENSFKLKLPQSNQTEINLWIPSKGTLDTFFKYLVNKRKQKRNLRKISFWAYGLTMKNITRSSNITLWDQKTMLHLAKSCMSALLSNSYLQRCFFGIIVKMQNICNLIGWNSVYVFDIFNCYRANSNGKWNTGKLRGIYKTFEFIFTKNINL